MVNIIVHKVCTIYVKRIRIMNFRRNKWWPKNRKEMSTPNNTIKMNNCKCTLPTIAYELWPYNPHSCVFIWIVLRNKQLDEGTRISVSIKWKRKKKLYPPNHHVSHTTLSCLHLNENGIMSSALASPIWVRTDPFLIHAACTAKVTGCKESSNGWVINQNSTVKDGTLIEGDIIWWNHGTGVELVVQEAP